MPLASAQEVSRPQLSEAQKQKTKEHYEKATRLYNVGKYQEAIGEYEAAYLVSADPVMLFNIAQCHRLNNQPDEAARFYKNYLRNAPGAPNRDDVERKIVEMERLSEERRRSGNAPGATEPRRRRPRPPLSPAPGPGARQPAAPDHRVAADVAPDDRRHRGRRVRDRAAAPAQPGAALHDVDQRRRAGGHLGGVRRRRRQQGASRSRIAPRSQMPIFDTGAKKMQDDGKAASGVAVVTGLAGLAAGGVGLFFLLRSPGSAETAAADSTGGTTARAGTAVFPVVGDGTWGAGARFSF